jgi:hypothetical protein
VVADRRSPHREEATRPQDRLRKKRLRRWYSSIAILQFHGIAILQLLRYTHPSTVNTSWASILGHEHTPTKKYVLILINFIARVENM